MKLFFDDLYCEVLRQSIVYNYLNSLYDSREDKLIVTTGNIPS